MLGPSEPSDDDNLLPDDTNVVEKMGEAEENNSGGSDLTSDEGEGDTDAKNKDDSDDGQKRRIDPTVKRVRAPQPKLNSERLKGPKGIQTIEKYFEGFQFHGKGHEKTDLNRVMKRLEHWSHRLFPKFQFDDCITRIEKLGSKKDVQVYLKKIRMGMVEAEDGLVHESMDADEDDEKMGDSVPIDEFDALIAEQLEKQKRMTTPQRLSTTAVNLSPAGINPDVSGAYASTTRGSKSEIELSAEMKERMERNRQIAIQKRLARIQAMEEVKRKKVDQTEDNVLSSAEVDSQDTKPPVDNGSSLESKIPYAPEGGDLNLELENTQPRDVDDTNLQSTENKSQENEQDLISVKSQPIEDSEENVKLENTWSEESKDNLQSIEKESLTHEDLEPGKMESQEDKNLALELKEKLEAIDSDLEATLNEVICHKYRRNLQ